MNLHDRPNADKALRDKGDASCDYRALMDNEGLVRQ